jgi:hypothetical protein
MLKNRKHVSNWNMDSNPSSHQLPNCNIRNIPKNTILRWLECILKEIWRTLFIQFLTIITEKPK